MEDDSQKISFRKILMGAIGPLGLLAVSAGIGIPQGYLHNLPQKPAAETRASQQQRKPDAVFVVRDTPDNARREAPKRNEEMPPLAAVLPGSIRVMDDRKRFPTRPMPGRGAQPTGGRGQKLAR